MCTPSDSALLQYKTSPEKINKAMGAEVRKQLTTMSLAASSSSAPRAATSGRSNDTAAASGFAVPIPKGIEMAFLVSSIGIIVYTIIMKNMADEHIDSCWDTNGNRLGTGDLPHISDWLTMVASMVFLSLLRWIMTHERMYPVAQMILKDKFKTEQSRHVGTVKLLTSMFKMPFFVGSAICGSIMLANAPYLGSELGGRGDAGNVFKGWPCNQQWHPWTRNFYMVEMSYHASSLLFHIFQTTRSDYFEMLLHHIVACSLIALSYDMNFVQIGQLVLLVHDVPDVFIYATKLLADVKGARIPCILSYIGGMLGIFGYLRLYVFPVHIIYPIFNDPHLAVSSEMRYSYVALLLTLVFLHVYWYRQFWIMGFNLVSKGKAEDIQHKSEPRPETVVSESNKRK